MARIKNPKLIIALTGSIGSGKTLIAQVFKHLGVPVYLSDVEAKKLYENKEMISQIEDLFGSGVITNGQIDKKKLADLVFNDSFLLKKLNNCVHPLVKQDFEKWALQQSFPYVIMESAIIYETGWERLFDKIICVSTPMDLVLQRVQMRDNQTKEQIMKRIANQMSADEKIKRSGYVINNDNIQLVIPQIREIHSQLLNAAANC
ncbi:MAG: dephospho-CoA kinase [Bacteroidales bacterium]|nr:dephospho-CoA kinase [Bacteroidales bacterium]